MPQLTAPRFRVHLYEIRPGKDKRGVDLISDVLPFGRLWYDEPNAVSNAIGYACLINGRERKRRIFTSLWVLGLAAFPHHRITRAR